MKQWMFVTLGWVPRLTVTLPFYAQQNWLAIVTRDFDFADIRNYPPSQYAGLFVLAVPEDAVATFVVRVLESFLANKELIEALPGRLAIVEPTRARLRPRVS